MTTTAVPPFLSEADPDQFGEGSLDPLGLAAVAEHLAEQIAPGVTARMTRVRFLTAIAVGATFSGDLVEEPAADGRSTPYLAYEWLVVEALARRLSPAQTTGVPGIQKARRALARSWNAHLDAPGYLQVPKVFGFHGVYKRLGRALDLIDDALLLLRPGDELARTWEREQQLLGFGDHTAGTAGGSLARTLVGEVRRALAQGGVRTPPGSHLWSKLAATLNPDGMGRRERLLLWNGLIDEGMPLRRELVLGLRRVGTRESEADALRAVASHASRPLKARLAAIAAYERVAQLLSSVFQAMRVASTGQGTRPVPPAQLANHWAVREASKQLPNAMASAAERLDPLGEGDGFERLLGRFADQLEPSELLEAVLEHHEGVQASKGPGKRPWLERAGAGFYVRSQYRTGDVPARRTDYLHPYRVDALNSFIGDLRPSR